MITAKIVEDSISPVDVRITTLQLVYPRFIHAEFMTHRVFSRNASSSRAEPVMKHIDRIRNEPAAPIYWGSNKPGMQAGEEVTDKQMAIDTWMAAKDSAVEWAVELHKLGLHKQIVNRVLEPFSHINVVVTSTEWDNFFSLRIHPDAQPEIKMLAEAMKDAMDASLPNPLDYGSWHLPYVNHAERAKLEDVTLLQLSTARCARVSYLKHDGTNPNIEDDIVLYERLVGGKPLHASPTEHQASPLKDPLQKSNNFTGWLQHREMLF